MPSDKDRGGGRPADDNGNATRVGRPRHLGRLCGLRDRSNNDWKLLLSSSSSQPRPSDRSFSTNRISEKHKQQLRNQPPAGQSSSAAAAAAGAPSVANLPTSSISLNSLVESGWSSGHSSSGPPRQTKRRRRGERDEDDPEVPSDAAGDDVAATEPRPGGHCRNERHGAETRPPSSQQRQPFGLPSPPDADDGLEQNDSSGQWLLQQLQQGALELDRAVAWLVRDSRGELGTIAFLCDDGADNDGISQILQRQQRHRAILRSPSHQQLYRHLLGLFQNLERLILEALMTDRPGERLNRGEEKRADSGPMHTERNSVSASLSDEFLIQVLTSLSDQFVALLLHLPVEDPASLALMKRASNLWMRVSRHRERPASASYRRPFSGSHGGVRDDIPVPVCLLAPTQWGLLLSRLASLSSSLTSPSIDPGSFMECAGSWVPVLLTAFPPFVTSRLAGNPSASSGHALVSSGHHHHSSNLASASWWLDRLRCLLPASSASLAESDWQLGLDRLLRGAENAGEVDDDHLDAVDSYSFDSSYYGSLMPEPLAIAMAYRSLTMRVLEKAAAIMTTTSCHDLLASNSAWEGWRYAGELAAHAVEVSDATDSVLDWNLSAEGSSDQSNDENANDNGEQMEETTIPRLSDNDYFYNDEVNGVQSDHFSDAEGSGRDQPAAFATRPVPSSCVYADGAVAFVVEHLEVALRTARAAEAVICAVDEMHANQPNNPSSETTNLRVTTMSQSLAAQKMLWNVYFPLWETASSLALSMPLTSRHGKLILALARRVLQSIPDPSKLPPWNSPQLWAPATTSSLSLRLGALVECWNTTLLRVCSDGPHWLQESKILGGSLDEDNDGDGDAYGPSNADTLEEVLVTLASWSIEIRHVLQVAALNLSGTVRHDGLLRESHSRHDSSTGSTTTTTRSKDDGSGASAAQKRLALILARACSSSPSLRGEQQEEDGADPWSHFFFQLAQKRRLLQV